MGRPQAFSNTWRFARVAKNIAALRRPLAAAMLRRSCAFEDNAMGDPLRLAGFIASALSLIDAFALRAPGASSPWARDSTCPWRDLCHLHASPDPDCAAKTEASSLRRTPPAQPARPADLRDAKRSSSAVRELPDEIFPTILQLVGSAHPRRGRQYGLRRRTNAVMKKRSRPPDTPMVPAHPRSISGTVNGCIDCIQNDKTKQHLQRPHPSQGPGAASSNPRPSDLLQQRRSQ